MKPAIIHIPNRNSDFQIIETLRRNRVKRNQTGAFFVEGVRAISLAVQNAWQIDTLVYTREKRMSDWAEGIIARSGAKKLYELPAALMSELSLKEEPSELVALVAIPEDDLSRIPIRDNPLILVLDRPILPGNIGTIIRSGDALRVDGLVITGHSADLYDPETIRATTGSFFSLPAVRLPSHKELFAWVRQLKERFPQLRVVGTSAKAVLPIHGHDFTQPTLLLAGNETHGLSEAYKAQCDVMVTIPISGSASSLNLASATSIMLYEIDRQRRMGFGM